MFGLCSRCGFTKELIKDLEFCPNCGMFLKLDPEATLNKGGIVERGIFF